jgi:hypothetical protein
MLSKSVVLTLAAILCSSATQAEASTDCNVQMNLDQKVFLEYFREIQQLGLLNESLDSSVITREPIILSSAFMLEMIPTATKDTYDEKRECR